jgi:very-short-patch-repair endonuclease
MLKRCREIRINGEMTSIEQAMADELDKRDIKYSREYPVLTYSLDFALVEIKVDIECDGRGWHSYPHQIKHDKLRDRKLSGIGWHTIRFTQDEIEESIVDCVDRLLIKLKELGFTDR